jgi:F-type H+-transporting ATPase subunit a
MEKHFSWFQYVPGMSELPAHVAGAITVAGILMVVTLLARLKLASSGNTLVPSEKVSLLNFFEIIAETLYKMTQGLLGKSAKKYFPLAGTLFIYILASNLIGMIPGMTPPTDNMNTSLACGLFVFMYYNYVGFRSAGLGYLKHFLGPVWWLAPLMLLIELVSHFVRPLSLGLRLSGNMQGDHMVLGVMTGIAPWGLLLPLPFYLLGAMICLIQAFVFTLLTMVYIAMAEESAHHH